LKDLDGTFLTTTMLNPTSSVRDKDAHSSLVALVLIMTNSVAEVAEDAPQLVEVVATAAVILSLMDADTTLLMKTTTARTLMVKIMPDSPALKFMEDLLEASVSLVL